MNTTDRVIIEQDKIRESYFHDLVKSNNSIKQNLLSILGLSDDLSKLNLIHEDRYINGIIADFTLVYNNKIRAIIECKAGDIGVTDYVRGIGQILQYEHFKEKDISSKGFEYDTYFNSILLVPSSVVLNKNFNIGKFKYPQSTYLIEINDYNKVARQIPEEELQKLSEAEKNNLVSISQYYVRDTRLFEIYMLLRYLCILKLKGFQTTNRKEIEEEMQKTESINNRNWRNVWISLSSLGFIDRNNMPTKSGTEFGMMNIEDFLLMMYKSYIYPYVNILMDYFNKNIENKDKGLKEIKSDFLEEYNQREILFFTQSETRYLSSWLNILRDDFGCIDFETRQYKRQLNYNPKELNDEVFKQKISEFTKSKSYIKNLERIL